MQTEFSADQTEAQTSMNSGQPTMSLSDPLMQLPLEQHIIPKLPVQAVACLASTCQPLRNVMHIKELDEEWWHRVAVQKLGKQHPVFQDAHPSRDQLRSAVYQYAGAVKRMQASNFKQGEACLWGVDSLTPSPDGKLLAASQRLSTEAVLLQVHEVPSFAEVMVKIFEEDMSGFKWSQDSRTLDDLLYVLEHSESTQVHTYSVSGGSKIMTIWSPLAKGRLMGQGVPLDVPVIYGDLHGQRTGLARGSPGATP
ncbi:hypothetical protein WJX73_010644 [Symbiochloris irregularis]|uniref:Uncharacterized protein n=1 Tax=Symbiochloris irregularis TaxID=706552 RepID=A0AAW1PYB5_9CHLO